ncbi:MAG: hypothetical protein JO340_16010 [Acidobacteriaceae bacterium]|nr:hypothetical protein [Acidobacteriaceae bacterium]
MATLFEAALEVLVGFRGMGRLWPVARMAMKMGEELVTKPFEPDEQIVGRGHVPYDPQAGTPLVREFCALVEHVNAIDLRAGNEEELLVRIDRELLETLMQEKRTHGIAWRAAGRPRTLCFNLIEGRKELVHETDFRGETNRTALRTRRLCEPCDELFALRNERLFLSMDVHRCHW